MTKKDMALKYAARGWKVFPCAPNTKIPLAGTHGVKDATDSIQIVEEWWTANPDANIGLACGSLSGIWVVDIDIRPKTGVDGFASVREAGLRIEPTLSQVTPSGGRHFLYGCDGEKPANKNGFLRGVDIRGDGYYIVVAPSTIDGKSYEWQTDCTTIAEFPDGFKPSVRTASVLPSIPTFCTSSSAPIAERARAYLAQIPGAVQGSNGHGTLFWVAQVLVNGFRLSDAEAEAMMWNEFNPRCSPPWDRNASTEREFRHKIAEAHQKPNPEAASIYYSQPESVLQDDFDFDKCIDDVRALLYPKAAAVTAPIAASSYEAKFNDLLEPEGLVGDIARWMNETSPCYQPLLSLGASITLCGAIMGRKVRDESDGRTNVYCMGVAPSSSGKDHSGSCINRILTAAGAQSMMMGRMTSDTAIEKALANIPHVKLAIIDEVGHFLSNVNGAGDGASYLKTIKPTLMELFSSAHKTYIGKEKANGNPPIIDQPCMCIWGVTVPDKLYSGMTVDELQDGWVARNLIFIAKNEIPDIITRPIAEVPSGIVETVRSWNLRLGQPTLITAVPGGTQTPLTVPTDDRARARLEAFNKSAREAMRKAHDSHDREQYLWGKAFQNARRIALIVACGREFENPVITEYDANYGCRLVETLVRGMIRSIAENVNENRFEQDKKRILRIIGDTGIGGISGTELCRKTQWVQGSRQRQSYLGDLAEAGLIRKVEAPTALGATKTVWMTAEFANITEQQKGVDHVDAE